MKLKEFKCINENVSLDDYYKLYDYVLDNMKNRQWLGYIPLIETKHILENDGKIWIYYDNESIVCSMFYIPSNAESLRKHKIFVDENITGSLGPIMVNPNYVGNGYMKEMLEIFDEYNKQIGNKYIFSKAAKDNIYSTHNLESSGYKLYDEYENERGLNNAYLKELN